MITRIILENFMAHEHTELELGPGVNALTGPNNTGKSAIVEALRCVATNPVPKYYIRHGASEARVTVEVEDGTRVVWVRKKRTSGYELWAPGAEEPEEYWKFGRKPPEDVLDVLRMDLVELEGDKEPLDVHVGNQRDPVFLLNQPKSDAAAFFAASTESAHLLAMQNLLKRKNLDAKRQEKDLLERMDALDVELDRFSPLPGIELSLEDARELEATAKDFQRSIPAIESLLDLQAKIGGELRDQTARAAILETMQSVPTTQDIAGLASLVHQITTVESARVAGRAKKGCLSGLIPSPETQNTAALARFCDELQGLETALAAASRRAGAAEGLRAVPEVENCSQLSGMINELLAGEVRVRRENRHHDVLLSMSEPPLLTGVDHLQAVVADVTALQKRHGEAETALKALEMQLQSLEMDIRKRVDELGHCPTCGAELSGVAFLERGCRHDG